MNIAIRILASLALIIIVAVPALADDDLWDVDKSAAPPPGPMPDLSPPVYFEGPNRLIFKCDKDNRPTISITPNPDKPIPVFYRLKEKNAAVYIELSTAGRAAHRRPSRFTPPDSNEFQVFVTYKASPADTGVFRVYQSKGDSVWTIEALHETGFVVLQLGTDLPLAPKPPETEQAGGNW